MRRKNEEVTGKPTQYNLQTLEYDWKELPDSHFKIQQAEPRVRDYAPYGSPGGNDAQRRNNANQDNQPSNANAQRDAAGGNRRRADEGAGMRDIFGGGLGVGGAAGRAGPSTPAANNGMNRDAHNANRDGPWGGRPAAGVPVQAPRSPQPAPAPSRPQQEDFSVFDGNADLAPARYGNNNGGHRGEGGDGVRNAGRGPSPPAGYRADGGVPGLDPNLLKALEDASRNLYAGAQGGPAQRAGEGAPAYVAPWSHEDLKRQVLMNQMEAARSYLRNVR